MCGGVFIHGVATLLLFSHFQCGTLFRTLRGNLWLECVAPSEELAATWHKAPENYEYTENQRKKVISKPTWDKRFHALVSIKVKNGRHGVGLLSVGQGSASSQPSYFAKVSLAPPQMWYSGVACGACCTHSKVY